MENILITLVLVGGLIYNIYNNYKKEMEKTAKRDIRVPAPPTPAQVPPIPKSVPLPPPVTPTPVTVMNSIPTEVSRMQKYKTEKKSVAQKPLVVEALAEEVVTFDLRQAVIHTVILERPYK